MIWISEQQQRSEHVEYMTDQVYRLYLSYPHYPVSDIRIIVCVIDFVWDLQNFNFVSRTESHYTVNLTNIPPTKRFYSIRIHENTRIEFPLRTSTFLLFRSCPEKSGAVKKYGADFVVLIESDVLVGVRLGMMKRGTKQNFKWDGVDWCQRRTPYYVHEMSVIGVGNTMDYVDFCSAASRKLVADEGFSTA